MKIQGEIRNRHILILINTSKYISWGFVQKFLICYGIHLSILSVQQTFMFIMYSLLSCKMDNLFIRLYACCYPVVGKALTQWSYSLMEQIHQSLHFKKQNDKRVMWKYYRERLNNCEYGSQKKRILPGYLQ